MLPSKPTHVKPKRRRECSAPPFSGSAAGFAPRRQTQTAGVVGSLSIHRGDDPANRAACHFANEGLPWDIGESHARHRRGASRRDSTRYAMACNGVPAPPRVQHLKWSMRAFCWLLPAAPTAQASVEATPSIADITDMEAAGRGRVCQRRPFQCIVSALPANRFPLNQTSLDESAATAPPKLSMSRRIDQRRPFQCSMKPRRIVLPDSYSATAQMSVLETAATSVSESKSFPPDDVSVGAGTKCHAPPFQCSTASASPAPTAHTFPSEIAATDDRPPAAGWAPSLTRHLLPFQCIVSAS